jgi:hypothetical protein
LDARSRYLYGDSTSNGDHGRQIENQRLEKEMGIIVAGIALM